MGALSASDLKKVILGDDHRDYYEGTFTTIIGVVSFGEAQEGGWPAEDDTHFVHAFHLDAWRIHSDSETSSSPLMVSRAVPLAQQGTGDFEAGSCHRMSVLLSRDRQCALLRESVLVDEPDSELLALADERAKPVSLSTHRFGTLSLDRTIGCFQGNTKWGNRRVNLQIVTEDEAAAKQGLRVAETLFAAVADWNNRLRQFAQAELVELKNSDWLRKREKPISADDLWSRMKLTDVSVKPKGSFEFSFADGGLFSNHIIIITGTLEDGPTDVSLMG